jgi:hypothetical protein
LEALGITLPRATVEQALVEEFVRVFDYDPVVAAAPAARLTAV